MKITLIIGLPGSGKTFLAKKLGQEDGTIVIDDIVGIEQLPDNAQNLIITDVNFCDETILHRALHKLYQKYRNPDIRCIYFENNPEKCRRNVLYRNDGRNVEGTIERFTKVYHPDPRLDTVIPIWQPEE